MNTPPPLEHSDHESLIQTTLEHLAKESLTRPVWIRVGQVIDGISREAYKHAHLVFEATRIVYMGTEPPEMKGPADADLPEYTVLPCLIESHAHLFLDGAPVNLAEREAYLKQPAEWMLERGKARWGKILQCGIGTVRDAGDKYGVGLALAAEAKKLRGELAKTPWIDSPGAAIHHKGRYGAFMGETIEEAGGLEPVVADRVAKGADRIKLLVSGIINFKAGKVTTPPQMSIEEVRALVVASKARGRQTFAHASGMDGVEHSIEGGVTTVEHGFFLTEEQLSKMRDKGIGWVPTFAPVQSQIDFAKEMGWDGEAVGHLKRIIEGHQKMLCLAEKMGVIVVAGSDAGGCGVPHGMGFLQELEQMERAGMSAMGILRSATGVSAEVLQFGEPVGRISAGCRARFIVTRHDPLETVKNLQKAKTVVFDGAAVHGVAQVDLAGL